MRVALVALSLTLWACGQADESDVAGAEPEGSQVSAAVGGAPGGAAGTARGEVQGDKQARAPGPAALPGFVGRGSCVECHASQVELFSGSHHDLAMQPADDDTVLGDFAEASLTHFGTTSRFFRRDGGFWVNTDGPDGEARDYPIAYTFGVFPLQQYLVPFPGGRLQVLPLCWDSRPLDEGGQRWFHLHPDEAIPAGDVLHWTGPNQNWNYQCAECHSTGLVRNYRPASDDYASTWTEIDVSCEACHGPAEAHLTWARHRRPLAADAGGQGDDFGLGAGDVGLLLSLKDPSRAIWEFRDDSGIATRSAPRTSWAQSETCARCHARRSLIEHRHRFGRPLLDNQLPALLDAGLYYPDGQPLEEVYVYGSFLQSPMHRAGVSCSDCHDPHALTVRGEGNTQCAGCHAPERFDRAEHHHHEPGSAGAACVDCHMPGSTYMVVDDRRDHRFAVPRPDLSDELGTPNACTGCHRERTASWAAAAALEWWGAERRDVPHHGQLLAAARRRALGSERALARLVADDEAAAIVRATALVTLSEHPQGLVVDIAAAAARGEPLLRLAAARAGEGLPPAERWSALATLLDDELLAVRAEAARTLAGVPVPDVPPELSTRLEVVLEEYREVQRVDAERPEAQLNLGLLAAQLGHWPAAEADYLQGLRLGPDYQPLAINLADLYRHLGRDAEGLTVLEAALQRAPRSPPLHHARGLALIRMGRYDEALPALQEAALGDPHQVRYSYVWAVALASAGRLEQAIDVLAGASADHPTDRELLYTLAGYRARAGQWDEALADARLLLALDPDDQEVLQLLSQLQQETLGDG